MLTAQQGIDPRDKSTAPVVMSMGAPDASTPLGAAWQQFLGEQGDATWWSRWSPATGTPKEIYGAGLPLPDWRGDFEAEARRQALQLLHDRHDLLGLGTSEFREAIAARMGKTWAFVFDQYFRGLPVIGGRADVRVHAVGRIPMFGSTAWPIPADFVTTPFLGELDATRIAWQQVGMTLAAVPQPGAPRQPRLVIWGDVFARQQAAVSLAWEIPISNVDANGAGPIGRYYVDARTGVVLHYTSDKHDCSATCTHPSHHDEGPGNVPSPRAAVLTATGTVLAQTRTGLAGNSAIVTVPVSGAAVVTSQGTVFTDANGAWSINLSIFTPFAAATYTLDGVHNAAILGGSSPVFSNTIFAGDNGIQLLQAPTGAQAAHTTTYHWIYRVNEFCRSILGNTAQLNAADAIVPTVNIASTCNAFYSGNTVNFYAAGGNCNNTAFSTVIAHEWGHGLDDRYGGISNSSGDGLSEGWGDIVAMYLVDNPIVADAFFTNGNFLRTGNNGTLYPPPAEVHNAGEVWMGFAWQLRQRLATTLGNRPSAIAITNDIVLGSIVANATDQLGALLQVFIADDNDGNLANATPHSTELAWACDAKNYPYPLGTPPSNDECSGAITIGNGVSGQWTNELALNSTPAWACTGFGSKDVWFRYLAAPGPLTVTTCAQAAFDTVIEVFSGSCGALTSIGCNDDFCSLQSSLTVQITTPGVYYIRVGGFNNRAGTFNLDVSGNPGTAATWQSYGTGCYDFSRAIYELFPTAASFDLNLSAMRLTRSGSVYNVSAVGIFVPPSATATALALGDDDDAPVALTGTFSYPGGSTSQLVVCSNGFVSAGAGNGTPFTPNANAWAASPAARWGTWHDFNPSAAGSGQVKFEQIGSVAYVTWDGVYDFASATSNTWQLQFNLTNGNVTFVWPTMSGSGNALLVGWAPAGPNPSQASRDLSTSMPFTTLATNTFALALAAATPTVGATVPLTTTHFPATSTLGALIETVFPLNPGTNLTSIGMPGCFSYVGTPNVSLLLFPSGGTATFNQVIPNVPSFMGAQMAAQSYAFAPGANSLGLVSSNGVLLTVGF